MGHREAQEQHANGFPISGQSDEGTRGVTFFFPLPAPFRALYTPETAKMPLQLPDGSETAAVSSVNDSTAPPLRLGFVGIGTLN